jgi:hypothetical protein
MSTARATPLELLKRSRERSLDFAGKAGTARMRFVLEKAQRDLERRLRQTQGLGGAGSGSFTAAQLRATLAQVRDVLRVTALPVMRDDILDVGKMAAESATQSTIEYIRSADKDFKGLGRSLAIDNAALYDTAVRGAEASILRRIGSDPTNTRQPGVLQRYGLNTVGAFEDVLQQRLIAQKPWADVRNELIAESPFLQGQPAYWAERIVRTEVMGANNFASSSAISTLSESLDDMVKINSATFDSRTSADSYAVHGQIRRPNEAFDSWFGSFMHPPDRPNDRSVVVPHRLAWPFPGTLRPKSDGEIAARWAAEGRKGSPPARPRLSTVPLDQFKK